MKTEHLFEMLNILRGVKSTRWSMVMKLQDVISKGDATVEFKKWSDPFKNERPDYYPLDLTNIRTWSTYDDTCIDLHFTVYGTERDMVACNVRIYNGESFNGFRTDLKFEASIILPPDFIHHLADIISYRFEDHLSDLYDEHLETKKKQWMEATKRKLLKEKSQ